jgi:hypothetical protein
VQPLFRKDHPHPGAVVAVVAQDNAVELLRFRRQQMLRVRLKVQGRPVVVERAVEVVRLLRRSLLRIFQNTAVW